VAVAVAVLVVVVESKTVENAVDTAVVVVTMPEIMVETAAVVV